MSRNKHSDAGRSEAEPVPPFWLHTEEDGVPLVDSSVIKVARDNWSWAFHLVKREIKDGTRAREIVQDVAVEVTSRLREDPEVGRNLNGYFRTAVIRHVKSLVARERRITYHGSAHDLETNHHPSAPDWTKVFEDKITLQSLALYMSPLVRRILHYRLLDFAWKQIASRLGLTENRQNQGSTTACAKLTRKCSGFKRRARAEGNSRNGDERPR